MADQPLAGLLQQVRACRLCDAHLPLGARPVLQASRHARLLIIGQAPGVRVHQSGIPWSDPSGERLRGWLQMSAEQFYDDALVAIMPMGFCYPGKGKGGDLPPQPECAAHWHQRLRDCLPDIRLTLLIGQYAQRAYLPRWQGSISANVAAWQEALPDYFPLPHPSPRNTHWLQQRPWFDQQALPALRQQLLRAIT